MIANRRRERDDHRHDSRAGEVPQEHEQHGDHQADADQQVVQHIVRGDVDKIGPLVEDLEVHALGEQALLLDLGHLRQHGLGGGQRFLAPPHHDDALDDVVLRRPGPRSPASGDGHDDLGDIVDVDRSALRRGRDDHIAEIVELVDLDLRGPLYVRRVERDRPRLRAAPPPGRCASGSPG